MARIALLEYSEPKRWPLNYDDKVDLLRAMYIITFGHLYTSETPAKVIRVGLQNLMSHNA